MQTSLVRMGGRAGERCCVNSWLDGPAESTLQMAHHQKLLSGPRICQAKMGKGQTAAGQALLFLLLWYFGWC